MSGRRACVRLSCEWRRDDCRLSGGWCDPCESPTQYDSEGNKCGGRYVNATPFDRKVLEYVIWENTRLNPNQAADVELVGYIVNAMRALERMHGIR